MKETHGVALFPGGFGTMDEGFRGAHTHADGQGADHPVVLVDKPGGRYWETFMAFLRQDLLKLGLISEEDFHFFRIAHDVDDAVAKSRASTGTTTLPLGRQPDGHAALPPVISGVVAKLNEEFCGHPGQLSRSCNLSPARGAKRAGHAELPRLVLLPYRRNFGRFRALIDAINAADRA
jgi:hypothetical protein